MPRTFTRIRLISFGFLALLALPLHADVPANDLDALRMQLRERVLRMTEFLDTTLPGTLGQHNLSLNFTPKFSDFRNREFVRYPLELRYGATDALDLIFGVNPFAPNPINSGRDHRWGPGEIKLGAKYDLSGPLFFYDHASIGIDTRIPFGNPPVPLNDHYTHVKPWLAVSRQLRSHPHTTFYTNLSYDRSLDVGPRSDPPPEVIRQHIVEVLPGLLYKPGEFGYFGEYRFRHIQEPHDWHLGHEIQVGTIWDVPLRRSAKWNLPGKWQIELAVHAGMEEGHGRSTGISARVNWRTTLREVLNHVSGIKSSP